MSSACLSPHGEIKAAEVVIPVLLAFSSLLALDMDSLTTLAPFPEGQSRQTDRQLGGGSEGRRRRRRTHFGDEAMLSAE